MNTSTGAVGTYQGRRRQVSLALLVAANIVPLLGVLLFQWDVATLMILYWSENLVLGFYTLLRMVVIASPIELPLCLFFCIHYGGFCAGHAVFIGALLLDGEFELQLLLAPAVVSGIAALLISHGASFYLNFLRGGERERMTLQEAMMSPYRRIVILHIAIIIGGVGTVALGEPGAMLVALVVLKIMFDMRLHVREHNSAARA